MEQSIIKDEESLQTFLSKNSKKENPKIQIECSSCKAIVLLSYYSLSKNGRICAKCSKERNIIQKYGSVEEFYRQRQEKCKKIWKEKYGVENPSLAESVKKKKKESLVSHYGSEEAAQCARLNTQKETCIKRYGSLEAMYLTRKEKVKKVFEDKYGVDNPSKIKEVQNKKKQTYLERYGVEWGKSEITKEKLKQTMREKYGVNCYFQSEEFKNHLKAHNLKKYGVEYFIQTKQFQKYRRSIYEFEGEFFDSKVELAYYLYQKSKGVCIKRLPKKLEFQFKGKTYGYYPDFEVNGKLVEVKGTHFLKEDGTWQNPFDHSLDDLYEAKHQCAIANGVEIIYSKDCKEILEWAKPIIAGLRCN